MFRLGQYNQLNGIYTIDLINLKIIAGSVYWEYKNMKELINALEKLVKEIKKDN